MSSDRLRSVMRLKRLSSGIRGRSAPHDPQEMSDVVARQLVSRVNSPESPARARSALTRLCTEIGADLGCFDREPPRYVGWIGALAHDPATVDPPPPAPMRMVAGAVWGHSCVSSTRPAASDHSVADPLLESAAAIGISLGNLDPLSALGECVDAGPEMAGPLRPLLSLISAYRTAMESRASLLFQEVELDRVAAGLALLVEPVRPDVLGRYLFPEFGDTEERRQQLDRVLEPCFSDDLLTADPAVVRAMYRSPLPEGLVALTPAGRARLAAFYRSSRSISRAGRRRTG